MVPEKAVSRLLLNHFGARRRGEFEQGRAESRIARNAIECELHSSFVGVGDHKAANVKGWGDLYQHVMIVLLLTAAGISSQDAVTRQHSRGHIGQFDPREGAT